MKLTKTAIDAMAYAGRALAREAKDLRWDDEVPGFGVRVWPSGKKTFFIVYRHQGRERFMSLGAHGVLTVHEARDRARELKVETLRGKDPLEEKRKRQQAAVTFGDLVDAYRARHLAKKKSARDDESMLKTYLEPWRNRALTSVKRADIARLHHEVGQAAPVRANRLASLLSKMFNLAKAWGFLHEHWSNPASGIERYRETERQRFVTPDELPRLVAAIANEKNLFVRAAIWMYLLTGLRKSELLRLTWANVDFTRKELRIPDTKSGRPHVIPVIPRMEELLRALPRLSGNPYVFCSHRHGAHLVDIKRNWESIRTEAELADVRIHDLRHTVASWLVSSGASLALVGHVLNHSSPRTTKRYAHFMTAPVVNALVSHEKALQAAVEANVHDVGSPVASIDSRATSAS